MLAVRTEGLTKEYSIGFWRKRPYVALDHLTMEVEQGEVFGFLGPNGAGKTTTLKLLMQLIYPTSGGAWILGKPAGDLGVKCRIGYLPEHPYFYDYLTAEELLTYFASLFGIQGGARRARVAAVLDEVGIGAERRMQLRQYSKGMVQRVGIAQAILNEPELVFFDEPTAALDPQARRNLWDLLRSLHGEGRTVVLTTHHLDEAEVLCERVAIMDHGRVLVEDRPAALVRTLDAPTRVVVAQDRLPVATARELPGVLEVGAEAAGLVLSTRAPGQLLQRLAELDALDGVAVHGATLEDVFLDLTGREYRS
jgi:ABC-2 type transport system ATP-binding protein